MLKIGFNLENKLSKAKIIESMQKYFNFLLLKENNMSHKN